MNTTLEPTPKPTRPNETDMVHLVDVPGDLVALCGAPLNGVPRDADDLDCVVCAELDGLI